MGNIEVKIFQIGDIDDYLLTFAVIGAKYRNKWIFCRHKNRNTWEIPGGHREPNEDILETAKRELREETGAKKFTIKPLAAYSVKKKNDIDYGKLFIADIEEVDEQLKYEIEEIGLYDKLPEKMTYPQIQPLLFDVYKRSMSINSTIDIVPMVTIFIEKGNTILMLKRAKTKRIAPNKWAGIGGHIEENEYKTPMKACIREIEEETGLKENDLICIDLKYLIIRNVKDETIREQYVYFAKTEKDPLFYEFSEGKLQWIDKTEVLKLEMPMTCQYILEHYFRSKNNNHNMEIGVATYLSGKETMLWNEMLDFDNCKGKNA